MVKKALLATLAVLLMVGFAFAVNAHFIKAEDSIDSDGCLTASFKEAGLGNNQNINYLLVADAEVVYQCVNHAGKCPQAANKISESGPVFANATFNSGKNGTITGRITVCPPPAPVNFSCPSGQVMKVASVSYVNVTLTDTNNSVTEDLHAQSHTFFVCP